LPAGSVPYLALELLEGHQFEAPDMRSRRVLCRLPFLVQIEMVAQQLRFVELEAAVEVVD
jgi:hypothetical protein